MEVKIYNLRPTNGRKSFNGKARVIVNDGVSYLLSYNTVMGAIDKLGNPHRYSSYYSATTNNHVKAFFGFTKEFWNLPLEKKPDNILVG